ncbi:MAG TPA: hypothetical protein VFH59_05130 [Frateuria sp.]|uniref:hypothetical protein n=1 Tax=Frateuria sp. TaxID=2211372 RepID=UPI002D7E5A17|nr:hypothetical protein [Frateuria sp.]HET6804810.1 hypothetical protein [Frateuria sp.]
MLVLKLPLLHPFDDNTATVVAALSSTVLAVAGAYGLWRHQTEARRKNLESIIAPIFAPLYTMLREVRVVCEQASAEVVLAKIRSATPATAGDFPLTPAEVHEYRTRAFAEAVEGATIEARSILAHWDSLQEMVLGVSPQTLPTILDLHRLASGTVARLPKLAERSQPKFSEQVGPQVQPDDLQLLDWTIGHLAKLLNGLDKGDRPVTQAFKDLEPGRAVALRALSS